MVEKKSWDWRKELSKNKLMSPVQRRIIEKLHDPNYVPFRINGEFVQRYAHIKPPFGFNGFGETVFMRTYSRLMDDGRNEQWKDTIERVVNGTYNMQKRWIVDRGLEWSDYTAQTSAQEMYDRMYRMKFLPPGRGLWAMGSEITEERGLYAALNNCGFTSTEEIDKELSKPFRFLMDMSMVGVGIGFDTKGAGKIKIKGPDPKRGKERYQIPDSREGWVESVGRLIDSYFLGTSPIQFSYAKIRPGGQNINGFGGKSSGPEPLQELHDSLRVVLDKEIGRPITSRAIVDIQNLIGRCVVAGNVRRSAEIALGSPHDEVFLDLKNYERHPERRGYGWTSNNSIFAELGMDYYEVAERIRNNGEPGLIWLENIRKFGRMGDPPNNKDKRAKGVNPCVEQSLEDKELCDLVENFPFNHASREDFLRTLKFSYLYAKTVTLGESHWEETNRILLRNRRIGCSVSGVAQFVSANGLEVLKDWLRKGYDEIQRWDDIYSEWMTIPRSIKTTSVKPSGSVSSVAGATPGMHWPISSDCYLRRMRLAKHSELLGALREAGYVTEDDKNDKSSLIVEFPVHLAGNTRSEKDVSMWEQFSLAAFLQEHWSDNQISCTIKFNPDLSTEERAELTLLNNKRSKTKKDLEKILLLTEKDSRSEGNQIEYALNYFQDRLKGISMLPKDDTLYDQPPFETITRDEYIERTRVLKDINFGNIRGLKTEGEKFCTNDVCELKAEVGKMDIDSKEIPKETLKDKNQ